MPANRWKSRRCSGRRSEPESDIVPAFVGTIRLAGEELARRKFIVIGVLLEDCRMIRWLVAAIVWGWLVFPAAAARLDPPAINNAELRSKPAARDKIDPAVVKAEILLDRAQFSPREIDGNLGENAQKALRAFAEANGLTPGDGLAPEVWTRLVGTSKDPVIAEYTISKGDVKGPFLKKLPAKMEDMKGLKALNYTSPREAIAEKFHISEGLLTALNPGKKFDKAGETIFVTNVPSKQPKLTIGRIEIDKSGQTVKAFDP